MRNGVVWEGLSRGQAQCRQLSLEGRIGNLVRIGNDDAADSSLGWISVGKKRRLVYQIGSRRGNVARWKCVHDIRAAALFDIPPLFVPIEEGFLLALVVDLGNVQGATDGVAVEVVIQCLPGTVGAVVLVEVVIGVVIGVAVELPASTVELRRAALERKAHGRARGD